MSSKLIMDLEKNLFAKEHLTKAVKICTALKIVSKKFLNGNYNAPAILFALLDDWDNNLSSIQKSTVSNCYLSKETAHEAMEMFLMIYNDDSLILDFLNKHISERYFRRVRKTENNYDEVQASVSAIINNGFLGMFLKDD